MQHAVTDDTIACRPEVTSYAGGKISACYLVFSLIFAVLLKLENTVVMEILELSNFS